MLDPQGNEMGAFSFLGEQDPKAILSAISLPKVSEGTPPDLAQQLDVLKASGAMANTVTIAGSKSDSGMIGLQFYQPASTFSYGRHLSGRRLWRPQDYLDPRRRCNRT